MKLNTVNWRGKGAFLALLVILGIFGYFLIANWSEFSELEVENPLNLVWATFFVLVSLYCSGALLDAAMKPHGVKLRKTETFGLATITRFSNSVSSGYLTVILRVLYFKKKHGVTLMRSSSSFVASNLMQLIISGSIVLLVLTTLTTVIGSSRENDGLETVFLVLGFLGILSCLLLLPVSTLNSLITKFRSRRDYALIGYLQDALTAYAVVQSDKMLLIRLAGWATAMIFSLATILCFLYQSLGIQVSGISVVFIAALSSWGVIFSITPGNIGIREGLMIFGAKLIGVPVAETLVVSILLRLISLTVSGLLSLYFAPRLIGVPVTKLFSLRSDSTAERLPSDQE